MTFLIPTKVGLSAGDSCQHAFVRLAISGYESESLSVGLVQSGPVAVFILSSVSVEKWNASTNTIISALHASDNYICIAKQLLWLVVCTVTQPIALLAGYQHDIGLPSRKLDVRVSDFLYYCSIDTLNYLWLRLIKVNEKCIFRCYITYILSMLG